MKKNNIFSAKQETFLDYLLSYKQAEKTKLPSISQIGEELGVSTSSLREQIELARNLGLIHVQPKTGITILPYNFAPAVSKSLLFAVNSDRQYFDQYSDLRNQIELAYFSQAASLLGEDDIQQLIRIVNTAKLKLEGNPIQIPHAEHRQFHLSIYKELENVFINGLLQSYWDLYELIGLDRYTNIEYLYKVWDYHEGIVVAIRNGNIENGYRLLSDHIILLDERK